MNISFTFFIALISFYGSSQIAIDTANLDIGKIVICGRISQMSATSPGNGLKNMAHVLVKRQTIRGFLIFDHENDIDDFQNDMKTWIINKKIKWNETIVNGIENSPQAFIDLLNGKNIGKMLVKI